MHLREKTLIVFAGDNGCTPQASGIKNPRSAGALQGRAIDGAKGDLTEGGSRVPLIVNWKGVTPAGGVSKDLIDLSDFFPTFAELAGAALPPGVVIDGRSFAPQLQGRPGTPREWVFVQLGQKCNVRDARWKLTNDGDLFDMKDAPFREVLTPPDAAEAKAARDRLQAALDGLRPPGATTPTRPGRRQSMKKQSARS
jgi:arylsulfatase A